MSRMSVLSYMSSLCSILFSYFIRCSLSYLPLPQAVALIDSVECSEPIQHMVNKYLINLPTEIKFLEISK
jgi:hypothetical protein